MDMILGCKGLREREKKNASEVAAETFIWIQLYYFGLNRLFILLF